MSIKLRRFCDAALEAMWLLAVVLVTLYFNIYTKDSRIFEPQKALWLRILVTLMLAVWAVRTLEEKHEELAARPWWGKAALGVALMAGAVAVALFVVRLVTWHDLLTGMLAWDKSTGQLVEVVPSPVFRRVLLAVPEMIGTFILCGGAGFALLAAGYALRRSWRDALRTAMVIPALAYVAVYVIATIGSVFPQASLYGGYVRGQGTLTTLAYIGLFFIIAGNVRRREQLERLFTVILLTSLPAALYGIVQKAGIDPLPWMGDVEARVASTMGNAIFIAAYLIMVLPLAGYRLLSTWERLRQSPPAEKTPGGRSPIFGPVYLGLLWGGLGLMLVSATLFGALFYSAEASRLQRSGVTPAEIAQRVWSPYGRNLLLFLLVAVLTVVLPAFLYTIMTLIRERWRPYAHLAGLLTTFLGIAAIMGFTITRTNGFVWMGYLAGLCGLGLLSRWQNSRYPWGNDALWADAVYILLVVQSLLLFEVIKLHLPTTVEPTRWWVYLVALGIFLASCYLVLSARIRGRVGHLAQLGGYAILALLQIACIVLTQSRGPLLGLLASSLFAFPLLWILRRRIRWALITYLAILVIGGILLAIFNLPETPLLGKLVMGNPRAASFVQTRIEPLKKIPYLGRFGRIADATSGTGKVRILIWFGDEIGAGSVGMIRANPLRTLIGYGPESMHVAYNPYYPPELAHVEKRNASPDRAHNAIIDELVTMGALGLVAYLFYFLAFFLLAWRLVWKAPDPHNQALAVGLLTVGVAHFVETLTGIPIVSTRMYMWLVIGAAVALTFMSPFRRETEEAVPSPQEAQGAAQRAGRRRSRRANLQRTSRTIPAGWVLLYGIVALAAIIFASRVHAKPMVADVFFWQAEQMQAQSKAFQQQADKQTDERRSQEASDQAILYSGRGLYSLQRAMALTPREDFYYLSLAQFYLSGADAIVQGAEQAALQAIQTQDPQAKLQFERQRDELGQQADALFRSTQLAILRARDLNPLNTDHYRNMSALYLGWFQATQQPAKLARSITYGEQAISMTPNNADLHNRLAQNYLIAANFPATVQEMVLQQAQDWLGNWEKYHRTSGGRTGDTRLPLVARYRQEAATLLAEGKLKEGMYILAAAELQYSLFLDERYDETYLQLGDLYWQRELYEEAALMYGAGIRLQPALLSRTSVPFTVWANQHRGLAEGKSPVEVRLIEIVRAGKSEPVARAYQAIADRTETALKDPKSRPAQQNSLHQQAFDAYQVLGYIQILRGDRPAAIRFLETALSHRQAIEVLKNLTLLYSQTGQFDLALARAQAALQFAQEKGLTTDVQALQGLILQLQQLQQQIQQAEARVASAPGDYQAHLDLANLYGQAGRLAEALAEAETALQLAPAEKRVEVQALVDSLRQLQEGTP